MPTVDKAHEAGSVSPPQRSEPIPIAVKPRQGGTPGVRPLNGNSVSPLPPFPKPERVRAESPDGPRLLACTPPASSAIPPAAMRPAAIELPSSARDSEHSRSGRRAIDYIGSIRATTPTDEHSPSYTGRLSPVRSAPLVVASNPASPMMRRRRSRVPSPFGGEASSPRRPIDELTQVVHRWATIQHGMHKVDPTCTIALREPGESQLKRAYVLWVFLLTQGSGKDKLCKLTQNICSLIEANSESETVKAKMFLAEDQIGRMRKAIRMGKVFAELSKMVSNHEMDKRLRFVMYCGNLWSICYFALDHFSGIVDMNFYQSSKATYDRVKFWKNWFSLFRIITAFIVDTWYWRIGPKKVRRMKAAREKTQAMSREPTAALSHEETMAMSREGTMADSGIQDSPLAPDDPIVIATLMHRAQLKRNAIVNTINLCLTLSALGFEPFKSKRTKSRASVCSIITSLLGMFKIVKGLVDNQITVQFC